jgi:pimeloyl-ACP methyl ester carboxylesterase
VGSVELEIFVRGPEGGESLLFLHDLDYLNGVDYAFIERLAQQRRVYSPWHPGFGSSSLPAHFDSIHDLAYVYLDLLREIGPAHVIGCGFGGWIAAEMAIRCDHDVRSLVLVDALGIKLSDRTTPDITDMFVVSQADLVKLSWHDAERGNTEMPLPMANRGFDEDALTMLLNNRRTAALVGWNPFMHDPKLRARLVRIERPCLVVWGGSDGIVSPAYGRGFAKAIPTARFELIEAAGHYPYLERPSTFLSVVEPFLAGAQRA